MPYVVPSFQPLHPTLALVPCSQDSPAFFLFQEFSELYPFLGHLHMPFPRSGATCASPLMLALSPVPPSELVNLYLTCSQLLNSVRVSKTHNYTFVCVVFDKHLSPKLRYSSMASSVPRAWISTCTEEEISKLLLSAWICYTPSNSPFQ